jgi:hypothetical protein
MFMPSDRIWEEMQYEPAGFWPVPINRGDEYSFLIKIPTHLIKAAYRTAPVTLTVGTAATPNGRVMTTVLAIADDDEAPFAISGVHRHAEEQLAFKEILRLGQTLLVFFDELSRPVARAHCALDPAARSEVLMEIEAKEDWYVGSWIPVLAEVLDEVGASVDSSLSVQPKHFPTSWQIGLTLTAFETNKITAVGNHEAHDFRLEDPDEGHGLEQTTWQLLENLFGQHIFHSPQVREQKGLRQLTDILGFCESGLCLFEAKTTAVLSTSMERNTERRTRNIQKQIDKGIAQLRGAMRNLSDGLPLSSKTGQAIKVPEGAGTLRVGVIMISELLPSVDWPIIAQQLIAAAEAADALLLVLDPQELRLMVGISKTPKVLMGHLVRRFKTMAEVGSAFIRARLDGPPLP